MTHQGLPRRTCHLAPDRYAGGRAHRSDYGDHAELRAAGGSFPRLVTYGWHSRSPFSVAPGVSHSSCRMEILPEARAAWTDQGSMHRQGPAWASLGHLQINHRDLTAWHPWINQYLNTADFISLQHDANSAPFAPVHRVAFWMRHRHLVEAIAVNQSHKSAVDKPSIKSSDQLFTAEAALSRMRFAMSRNSLCSLRCKIAITASAKVSQHVGGVHVSASAEGGLKSRCSLQYGQTITLSIPASAWLI